MMESETEWLVGVIKNGQRENATKHDCIKILIEERDELAALVRRFMAVCDCEQHGVSWGMRAAITDARYTLNNLGKDYDHDCG